MAKESLSNPPSKIKICCEVSCNDASYSRNRCRKHYRAWAKVFLPTNRYCSLPDCSKPHSAFGYCTEHYDRYRRHNDPTVVRRNRGKGQTFAERFWDRVLKSPTCWYWQGVPNNKGYGVVQMDGKVIGVHVAAWILHHGVKPIDCVLHKCDCTICVNPDHLYVGSHLQNMNDARIRGRQAKGERSGNSKLRLSQVQKVKAAIQAGESDTDIAKAFNVSRFCIYDIRRGRTWKEG